MRTTALLVILVCAAPAGTVQAQRPVYPYRYDSAEHPENALRHYQGPTWRSAGGRLQNPDSLLVDKMNKITRIAGIDLHLRMIHALGSPNRMSDALEQLHRANLRSAWNPLSTSDDWRKLPVDLFLLANRRPETGALLPFHGVSLTGEPREKLVIFDAEYLSWSEIQRDVDWWRRESR